MRLSTITNSFFFFSLFLAIKIDLSVQRPPGGLLQKSTDVKTHPDEVKSENDRGTSKSPILHRVKRISNGIRGDDATAGAVFHKRENNLNPIPPVIVPKGLTRPSHASGVNWIRIKELRERNRISRQPTSGESHEGDAMAASIPNEVVRPNLPQNINWERVKELRERNRVSQLPHTGASRRPSVATVGHRHIP